MVKLARRAARWFLRQGGRAALLSVWRWGGRSALGAAAGVVPQVAQRLHTQVFNVTGPTTVFLRAGHCQVTVRPTTAPKVILEANLFRAFGVDLAGEQDSAGVYIVVKRKPVVGQVARIDLTLYVPLETHLALHVTPGDIVFEGVDGLLELPASSFFQVARLPRT